VVGARPVADATGPKSDLNRVRARGTPLPFGVVSRPLRESVPPRQRAPRELVTAQAQTVPEAVPAGRRAASRLPVIILSGGVTGLGVLRAFARQGIPAYVRSDALIFPCSATSSRSCGISSRHRVSAWSNCGWPTRRPSICNNFAVPCVSAFVRWHLQDSGRR
jgi:hypothetical protein